LAEGDAPVELGENLTWCAAENFTNKNEVELLTQLLSDKRVVAPNKILTLEGSPLEIF